MRKSDHLVKYLLMKHPAARLHDAYLVYYYLRHLGHEPERMSAAELLSMWRHEEILSLETLVRCRRRVQAKHPELRCSTTKSRSDTHHSEATLWP